LIASRPQRQGDRRETLASAWAWIDPTLLALCGGVAAVYFGAAKLGIELSVAHGVITPVWPPAGIALAALVLGGPRLWPAIAAGALIANATSGASIPEAAFIAVGNTLEALVGAALLRRAGFRPQLDRVRDVLALVLLAAAGSTAIAATNGVTTLWVAGNVEASHYGSEWLLWWLGDAMGVLIVAPLLLVWASVPLRRPGRARLAEAVVLLALLAGVSSFVFLAGYWRYPHLLFPLLVWAALRFEQRGAVTASFVVAAIAVAGAVTGNAPLGSGSTTHVVQILEGLLAGVTVSLLLLGAILAERTAAKDELEGAHASLAEAQEVGHIGSWEWSIADDRVTWSDALFRIYGLEPQSTEVSYESYLEHVHPADRSLVEGEVERAFTDRGPFAFEHRIVAPDGSTRWTYSRGRVVSDENGVPVRMVGTAQDITERKRVDELRDNILSAVSHELRTPLTSIVGFSMTLKEHGAGLADPVRAEIEGHLVEQAARLEGLLADLLDLDRLRHGVVRPSFRSTDIAELAARVAASQQPDDGRVRVEAEPVEAEVDAAKVERIVENLLANALKHTPAGTGIVLRVSRFEDGVLIAVDDAGPGVPLEHRQEIFEIFNRGRGGGEHVPGTGIGLSLVAQFTALHDGRAWVENAPGGGASFRVLLPLRQA
jgi:PAS domain S-box-containing protein